MPDAPRSLGIIMDGNRRWARACGLPTIAGHEAGARKLGDVVRFARAQGVEEITVYAFSTENWNRSPEEVDGLMRLFERFFTDGMKEFSDEDLRIRFIGDLSRAASGMQERIRRIEEETRNRTSGTLVIAFSYGGRAEIVAAANTLIALGKPVSEEEFTAALWTKGLRDPDLIVRTGGEVRLSNFLPWQSVYSELAFTPTLWPDLEEAELARIFADYASRERRQGK
jgi:undecaprenyl diphosphate synthase